MAEKEKNDEGSKKLEGFDIKINEFGEIESNFNIDKINEFLNENLDDKKLTEKERKEEE